MPFIGNQPALSYTSFAVQHFTTSATTSYTLDYSVANENEIRLVINNVVQQPGSSYAYTASGTTLTLSAATSATDTMYAVFLGKAVQTVTPASGSVTNAMIVDGTIAESKLASGVNTITMADQWRLTADITGDHNPISTNLERVDTTGQGTIGTGMTESSGNFTFPQTGLYFVESKMIFNSAVNISAMSNRINITTDNSTYSLISIAYAYVDTTSSARRYITVTTNSLINVTDTANIKVQFRIAGSSSATIMGSTSANYSNFTFIRLGDSV